MLPAKAHNSPVQSVDLRAPFPAIILAHAGVVAGGRGDAGPCSFLRRDDQ